MSSLSIFVEHREKNVVATLRGMADMGEASKLDHQLDEIVAKNPSIVVIELSALNYLNSLTIGSLVRTQQILKKNGGQLRIANPSPYAAGVLKATKVGGALPTFASVELALQ